MITRGHVMPYVGQPVTVRTRDGVVHRGILHSVVNDGIYVRPVGGRLTSSELNQDHVKMLGELPDEGTDVQETWLPFLFFPWLFIGAFWPWFWW